MAWYSSPFDPQYMSMQSTSAPAHPLQDDPPVATQIDTTYVPPLKTMKSTFEEFLTEKEELHVETWDEALEEEYGRTYWQKLFVRIDRDRYEDNVYPRPDEVFTWARYCAVNPGNNFENDPDWTGTDVKVVILGQDPYPTAGRAHGLAFSSKKGRSSSLSTIYGALVKDGQMQKIPSHGDLTSWAKQGALLLNVLLSVLKNQPNSHKQCLKSDKSFDGIGWETFTDAVIKHISDNSEGVVFMLWGKDAKAKENLIDEKRHLVLTSCHPVAWSGKDDLLIESDHFSKANKWLQDNGRGEIVWKSLLQ